MEELNERQQKCPCCCNSLRMLCKWIPQRVVLTLMVCLAIVNAYTLRNSLSMAITEMTYKPNNATNQNLTEERYDWDQETQGYILSAFYAGYIITHIPGALLAEKYGGKYVLSLGILCTAVLTISIPFIVRMSGAMGLIVLRVLMGIGEGTTFPALSALMAAWVPTRERGLLGSLVFGGCQFGTIISTFLSGVLISYFETWSCVFYFFGVMAIIWFLIFTAICYSDPRSHPFITNAELVFLKEHIGDIDRSHSFGHVPWKSVFKSKAVIALLIAQIGHDWGLYVMISDLPKYMSDVLNFSLKSNAKLSSLPWVAMWIMSVLSGLLMDCIIRRKLLHITPARRIFTAFAAIVPGIFMVLASYSGFNRMMAVVCFCCAMGSMGVFYPSLKVNPIDLAPNYAGTLMALSNGLGSFSGILAPLAIGFLTPHATLEEWRIVFWLTCGILIGTVLLFIFCGSGEPQPFNDK